VDEQSFDLIAARLRADAVDIAAFVEALAAKLEGALPGRVTVVRRGAGLFDRRKRVREIALVLDDRRYQLDYHDGVIGASCLSEVRGITIKSERLDLDEWIAALSRELAAHAQESEQGRLALERMLEE
jgi:uncharacterized protein YhdP